MTTGKRAMFGWRVFGVGVFAIGLINLALGNFDPSQPVPKAFPDRTILAYASAIFLLIAGAAIEWRRTTAWAAAALAAYYALIVVVVMNGRIVLKHPAEYGAYSGAAEVLAIAAAALIIYAAPARIDTVLAARLRGVGQFTFGICAVLFGGAHFVYPELTIPLVPKWLPPSQAFWAYATGIFHIAGGMAIIVGFRARLAAFLLAAMYAAFTPLVHLPLLLGAPSNPFFWTENTLNLALVGVAWVVADSFKRKKR